MNPRESLLSHDDARPSVTVVLPVYNREGSIRAAIASVLEQTHVLFDLIVVDDCSTDRTAEMVLSIRDPRLTLLRHPTNRGAPAARNTGARSARSDWIAFQDSDDEWLPSKLEKQLVRIQTAAGDAVACYCGLLVIGNPECQAVQARTQVTYVPRSSQYPVEGDIRQSLRETSLVSTQTLIVRRDAFEAVGGFDEQMPALQDWELVIRLSASGSFAFVDEPLVLQHFSENSITRDRRRRLQARQRLLEKHRDFFAVEPQKLARQLYTLSSEALTLLDHDVARRTLSDVPLRRLSLRWWLHVLRAFYVRHVRKRTHAS